MRGVTLNTLLQAALGGQPYNNERLGREAKNYVRKLAHARAADLPEDIQEEIVGEAFVQLLQRNEPNKDSETTPIKEFRKAVLAAIRRVRASYAPPGQRTRKLKDGPSQRIAAEDVGRIPEPAALEASFDGEGNFHVVDFDRLQSPEAQSAIVAVEHRADIAAILAKASPAVSTALCFIYLKGEPVGEVARSLNMSRFAMNRQIAAFVADWRVAA